MGSAAANAASAAAGCGAACALSEQSLAPCCRLCSSIGPYKRAGGAGTLQGVGLAHPVVLELPVFIQTEETAHFGSVWGSRRLSDTMAHYRCRCHYREHDGLGSRFAP
jgi:hypothetical protein